MVSVGTTVVYLFPALAVLFAIVAQYNHKHGHHRWPFKYKSYGDSHGSGETIVLIPGLDGCTSFFNDVLPELTTRHRVVVASLPLAKGPFDPHTTTEPDIPYSFEYIAASVNAVIDELNLGKVHLVGESFGGVVAQHVALLHPNVVKTMTIISSLCHTELTPTVQFKAHYVLPVVEALGSLFPGIAQHLFARFHVDDVVERFEPTWVKDFFVKEASWAHHYSVIQRIRIVINLDICDRVPSISAPSLVVYGKEDNFTQPGSFELHKSLPNSEIVGLAGGHLPHVTSPKAFSDVLLNFIHQQGTENSGA